MVKSTTIIPLSSARKNHELNMAIQESYKNKKIKEENKILLEDANLVQDNAEKAKLMSLGFERKKTSKISEFVRMDEVFGTNFDKVMKNIFATIVYDALPVDDDIKEQDVDAIYEEAGDVFVKLSEAGIITITGSPLFRQFSGATVKYIEGFKNELTQDQVVDIVKSIYADEGNSIEYLSKNVYAKTASVVNTEKELVSFNNDEDIQKVRENRSYVRESMNNTLFRHLNEQNISELTGEGLSKDQIMDVAVAESLFTYTVLETLHTSKLIKVDIRKLHKLSNIL